MSLDTQPLAASLVKENFSVVENVLHIGGRSVAELAATHGTPLFVCDADLLRRAYRRLAAAVRGFAKVYYSIKANPNPALIRVFLSEGAGLEIASGGEFERGLVAGCPAEKMLFAGPGKTNEELERVVHAGIGEIHIESEGELERVAAIARRLGRVVQIAIRVNPVGGRRGGAMLMGGRPSPFGVDEERLPQVIGLVRAEAALALSGVHIFTGTQILNAEVLRQQWAHGIEIARQVACDLDRPLRTVDLGGGLGIPYFANDRPLDLSRVSEIARELSAIVRTEEKLAQARFIIEPGRFLTGSAGVYVTRVIDVKESRSERFVIVDGGMHHHLAASGNLGQAIKRDYPLVAATRMKGENTSPAAIVGPLCTPLDVLARRAELPEIEPGDLVAVLQSGAYALTASPVGFLSRPLPAEVLLNGGSEGPVAPSKTAAQSVMLPA